MLSTAITEWNGKECCSLFRSSFVERRHGRASVSPLRIAPESSTHPERKCDRIVSRAMQVYSLRLLSMPLQIPMAMLENLEGCVAIVRSMKSPVSSKGKTVGQHKHVADGVPGLSSSTKSIQMLLSMLGRVRHREMCLAHVTRRTKIFESCLGRVASSRQYEHALNDEVIPPPSLISMLPDSNRGVLSLASSTMWTRGSNGGTLETGSILPSARLAR